MPRRTLLAIAVPVLVLVTWPFVKPFEIVDAVTGLPIEGCALRPLDTWYQLATEPFSGPLLFFSAWSWKRILCGVGWLIALCFLRRACERGSLSSMRRVLACAGRTLGALVPLSVVPVILYWCGRIGKSWTRNLCIALPLCLLLVHLLLRWRILRKRDPEAPLRVLVRPLNELLGDLGWVGLLLLVFMYAPLRVHRAGHRLVAPQGFLVADLHSHSDTTKDALMDGDRRLELFAAHGIDLTAVSEHGYYFSPGPDRPDFFSLRKEVKRRGYPMQVLPAQEFTTHALHLVILGGRKSYNRSDYRLPDCDALFSTPPTYGYDFARLIADVHQDGAFSVVSHWWMPFTWYQVDWRLLIEYGVDGFEITNGAERAPSELIGAWRDKGLKLFAANDFHYVRKSLYAWNLVPEKTVNPRGANLPDVDPHKIVQRMFSKPAHRPVAVRLHDDRVPVWLEPPFGLVRYFRSLEWHRRLSWILWIALYWLAGKWRRRGA